MYACWPSWAMGRLWQTCLALAPQILGTRLNKELSMKSCRTNAAQFLPPSAPPLHKCIWKPPAGPEAALGKTEAFPPCGFEPRWSSEFMRNGTPLKSSHNTDGAESSSSSSYCNCQEQVPFAGCCGKVWESSPVLRPSDVTSSEIEMKSKN